MSENDPYRVFVTHLFEKNEDYERVFDYLTSRDTFYYVPCSKSEGLPGGAPEAVGAQVLKDELINQIKPAEVVIMPVGMFDLNPSLMKFQVDVAQANDKPIIDPILNTRQRQVSFLLELSAKAVAPPACTRDIGNGKRSISLTTR